MARIAQARVAPAGSPEDVVRFLAEAADASRSSAECVALYDRALEIDPTHGDAHSRRAIHLGALGRFDEAIAASNRALELEPDNPNFKLHRLWVLSDALRNDEALEAADDLIALDASPRLTGKVYAHKANILIRLRRFSAAVSAFDHAVTLQVKDGTRDDLIELIRSIAEVIRFYAEDCEARGRKDTALSLYKSAFSGALAHYPEPDISERAEIIMSCLREIANEPRDDYDTAMDTGFDIAIREVVARHKLPEAVAQAAIDAAQAVTARAPETKRLKWGKDNAPDENPAAFAWRAYQAEAKAGTLHMGIIREDDRKNGTDLAVKLVSWLRSAANRKQVPEGFDIPTKPEWNTRQLARRGGKVTVNRVAVRPEDARLYAAASYRAKQSA